MPRVEPPTGDEFERRAGELAALIRRVWRSIARTFSTRVQASPATSTAAATYVPLAWSEALNGPVLGYVSDVYVDAAGAVAEAVDAPGDLLVGEDLLRLHLTRARNRLRGIGDEVWDVVREQLLVGTADGDSAAQLAARIRNVTGLPDWRAATIARTEVHAALEAGSYDQALLVDPDARKIWLATNDSRTRETHRAADGQNVAIGDPFRVGGSTLRFPGDPLGAADETVNCRCSVMYDFDIVTSMDGATSDDLVAQIASAFAVPVALVAAGTRKWNPTSHPRGADGKFIKKGSVSDLLSKKKPLIGDVSAAVNDLTPATWKNLTQAQRDYITEAVGKLPTGSKLKQDASAKLDMLVADAGAPAAPPTPKVAAPTKSPIPAHKGAAPGSPAKVSTGLIWGKYEPGTVILDGGDNPDQIVWNGKKYEWQSKDENGNFVLQFEMTKKSAYETLKDNTHWLVPDAGESPGTATPAPSPTPPAPSSSVLKEADQKLWEKGLMTTPEFKAKHGESPKTPGGTTVAPKKTAKKVAKKTAPPTPTKDAILADLKSGIPLTGVESVYLVDNMTISEWNDLTESQQVTLALSIDKALDNGLDGANNAFKALGIFQTNSTAKAPKSVPAPSPLSYTSEQVIEFWPGVAKPYAEGDTVALSGDGKLKLEAGAPASDWKQTQFHVVDIATGETIETYTGGGVAQSWVNDDFPGDWIVPPLVSSKPSAAMSVPATSASKVIGDDEWEGVSTNIAGGDYSPGDVVAQSSDGTLAMVLNDDQDSVTVYNDYGTEYGTYNTADLESGAIPANFAGTKWQVPPSGTKFEKLPSAPAPAPAPTTPGTLSPKIIFAVGLTGAQDGDVLAVGESPGGFKYKLTAKKVPTGGKLLQLHVESKPGEWTLVDALHNVNAYDDAWGDTNISWNPPSPDDNVEEIEDEDGWIEAFTVGAVSKPTVIAQTTNGEFQVVAHPDDTYTIEEKDAGTGNWIDIETFSAEQLDDDGMTISDKIGDFTSGTWVKYTPGAPPVSPTPASTGKSLGKSDAPELWAQVGTLPQGTVLAYGKSTFGYDGEFRILIGEGWTYDVETRTPGTEWEPHTTGASLTDLEKTLGNGSLSWNQADTSGVTPVAPVAPTTPVPDPPAPPTATGDISGISYFVKTQMKKAFKDHNAGYWSKPEKIWDVIKKIQAQYPDPDNPGQSKLSPLQILKSMDSLHKGKDPSPYETKMVKWAASAKGQAHTGNVKIESTGGISTGPKTAPPTPFTAQALWASLGSKNDGDVVAEGTASNSGLEWQFKKATTSSGESVLLSYYKKPDAASWAYYAQIKDEASFAGVLDGYKLKPKAGAASASVAPKPTSPAVPAAGALDVGTGDISHLSETQQQALYDKFKKQPSTYLSSPDPDIFVAAKTIASDNGISLLQMLRVIDAIGAKKVSKPDEHLFEKKILAWLKTPKGAAVASGKPLPKPPTPKYSPGVDPKNIPSLAESDKLTYSVIQHAKASALDQAAKAASPAGKWTSAQQSGLRTYTGGTYYSINGYYRGELDTISPTNEKAAKNAQLAMRPSTEPMLLHRGSGWAGVGGAKNHDDVEKMLGQTWEAGGFMSTSIGGTPAFGGPVMIEVEAPPGTPMAYVEVPPDVSASYKKITQYPGENEIVLGAGLHYKIISVKKAGGKTVVRMRVVPPPAEEAA